MNKLIIFLFSFVILSQVLMANPLENAFAKGFLTSKLEDKFPSENIEFELQDDKIIIYIFPSNIEVCKDIELYLNSFQNYKISFDRSYKPSLEIISETDLLVDGLQEEGNWLPELSPFFSTMLAQPHIIGYSAGYRSYDKRFKTSGLPVSIGDQFSLYQIKIGTLGRLYIGIEACVWAIFEARAKSLSLINADYYAALPLTYINNRFAIRLRVFHQSSHLGDEFLLEHKQIKRLNPSMEVIDLAFSYDVTDRMTAFFGFSRVLRSDDSYKIKPNMIYYGVNYFLNFLKIQISNLEAIPYIAAYFTNLEDNNWKLDSYVAIGYQWDKLYSHKFRIFIEGHDGFSAEGQFSKQKTRYLALKILYGY